VPASVAAAVEEAGLVPVLVLDDPSRGPALLDALVAGGVTCVEITLRTEAGLGLIEHCATSHPDVVLGAGTVLTPEDVDRVADAGARFLVSPGLDEDVVARALDRGILPVPGVATASEVQRALRLGLTHLKLFPAEQLGGVGMISALAGPFPGVRFLPSGGVSPANAAGYLAHSSVFAISGGWMATRALLADGDYTSITRLSQEAVDLVAGSRA
jgi:2-dehydro-3-deoxyphosphogluconate aldolase / (4S)-4-hydroxy-2-oxoglutarate aldolase